MTPAISSLSAASAALTTSPAATSRVEHEGEVAAHGQQIGGHRARARQPLLPLRRQRLEEHLECGDGAGDIERAQRLGMQLAEVGKHDLGAEPQRAGAAGMKPGRRLARQLRLRGVEAELGQQRDHIGLGVEEARLLALPRPSGGPAPTSAAAPARTPEAAMNWSSGASPR